MMNPNDVPRHLLRESRSPDLDDVGAMLCVDAMLYEIGFNSPQSGG